MTEEELNENSNIIFENDNIILVEVYTISSAKYYLNKYFGDMNNNFFNSSYRGKDVYIVVDKKNDDNSVVITIISEDRFSIENSDGTDLDINELLLLHPSVEKFLLEKINPFSMGIYYGLKLLSENKYKPLDSEWEIEQSDPLIHRVILAKKNPKNTLLFLRFNSDEDYFKTFDFSDDDIWFLNIIFDSYGNGFDFVSEDYYDWEEGRLFYYLNENNIDKLNEILGKILPGIQINNETLNNQSDIKKIVDFFDQFYPDLGHRMTQEYVYYENIAINESAKKEITEDLCNIYEKNKIFVRGGCFWEYIINVSTLLKLFEKFNMKSSDIYGVITALGHTKSVSNYGEYMYEFYGDMDVDSFNSTINSTIDDAHNAIMNHTDFVDIEQYGEIIKELYKKYQFNRWYKFPSDSTQQFVILSINPKNNKIVVRFMRGPREGSGTTELSLDDFYNTINNLSLF